MDTQHESFWKRYWNQPHYFFLWLAIFSAAGLGIGFVFDIATPDIHPPSWFQSLAMFGAAVLTAGLFIGVLCFILSWIPPIHRLLVWVLQRRLFIVACGVTLIVLFYAVENFRGKWRWEHFQREWEAKGEKFDLANFVPPSVPDDQNLAQIPLFKSLFDYVQGTNGVQWRDTNGMARLREIRVDQYPEGSKNEAPAYGSVDRGRFIDLEAWSKFYRGNSKYSTPPVPGAAAADVLTALGKFDTELAEIQQAAITRPMSRFPIHYEDQPAFGILIPHLVIIKGLCQVFLLRAIARLELRQSDEALADLQTAFRLSDSIRDEPFQVDHLVRISTVAINLEVVREGLVRHAWTDAQLVAIEKYLGSLDILAEYKKNMRSNRAFTLSGVGYYRRLGFSAQPAEMFFMDEEGDGQQPPAFLDAWKFAPGGWYYHNMVWLSRMFQEFSLAAVDERERRVFPGAAEPWPELSCTNGCTPFNVFAIMLKSSVKRSPLRNARIQSYVDIARIACALERYRLAHGKLPETLDVLAPGFMEKIPTDVMDGKPLRYRLDSDGSYVIYSVGWNETDDGGTIFPPADTLGTRDGTKGDWVWQMPAGR